MGIRSLGDLNWGGVVRRRSFVDFDGGDLRVELEGRRNERPACCQQKPAVKPVSSRQLRTHFPKSLFTKHPHLLSQNFLCHQPSCTLSSASPQIRCMAIQFKPSYSPIFSPTTQILIESVALGAGRRICASRSVGRRV